MVDQINLTGLSILLTATLIIGVHSVQTYDLNTDGYLFKFQVDVRFKSNWREVHTDQSPAPIVSPDNSFSLYEPQDTPGHIAFYIQTEANVGPNGRGAPQAVSRVSLTSDTWYKVTCEKTLDQLCLWINDGEPVCSKRTVEKILFKMKGQMPAKISMASVGNMEARNFEDLSSTLDPPHARAHAHMERDACTYTERCMHMQRDEAFIYIYIYI